MIPLRDICKGLVEILAVDMKLVLPSKPFGPVTGGTIQLRGLLANTVLVKKSNTIWVIELFYGQEEDVSGVSTMLNKIKTCVYWDEEGMDDMVLSVNVYFAPFEATISSWISPEISGLLLLPVYQHAGQFRRIGTFRVEDSWGNEDFGEKREADEREEGEDLPFSYMGMVLLWEKLRKNHDWRFINDLRV
jgi:hypothetical protein